MMAGRVASKPLFIGLSLFLLIAFLLSLTIGAVAIPLSEIWQILLLQQPPTTEHSLVIWQIRLPRTLLGMMSGAILAISGVAMQGLFRNPLADPGLIGISSGAAMGAGFAIVLGSALTLPTIFEPYLLSSSAFIGGTVMACLVYLLGQRNGRTDVATMLLAGVAITALSGAVIGLFTFIANDTMLRKLTFWNMGSLAGATYFNLIPLVIVVLVVCVFLPFKANGLNALLLGESEARHLGVNVERLKIQLILCAALGVGAAVAITGIIGFIGLVVPHLIRLLVGPNHKILLPASAMAGAILLVLADIVARVILAPAELQIGIVTALLGAPFFLYLLLTRRF